MTRQDAIYILVKHRDELRARGVTHAAVFGSLARGDAGPDSDVDIMVDLDPDAKIGVFQYVSIKQYIEELFSNSVDVVDRKSLKPHVRPSAESDALYAF